MNFAAQMKLGVAPMNAAVPAVQIWLRNGSELGGDPGQVAHIQTIGSEGRGTDITAGDVDRLILALQALASDMAHDREFFRMFGPRQ